MGVSPAAVARQMEADGVNPGDILVFKIEKGLAAADSDAVGDKDQEPGEGGVDGTKGPEGSAKKRHYRRKSTVKLRKVPRRDYISLIARHPAVDSSYLDTNLSLL
jgi:hypothetical protein